MQHAIPVDELGSPGDAMAGAIGSCVHCGFCLPTCPTYVEMGDEMNSPRGRIFIMKEVLEGKLEVELAMPYIDNCLGCQACETACPSGVPYGELITPFRDYSEAHRHRALRDRLRRALILRTLPHPSRFRAAARAGRLAKPLAGLLPAGMKPMLDLLPARLPASAPLPAFYPAEGERRARVGLLAGCAQQVLAPEINWATLRVLSRNGVEVVVPPQQGCCGALPMHAGMLNEARALARGTIEAFPTDLDAVITNAAGCGSGIKEYQGLFSGRVEQGSATDFAGRAVDVSAFLATLGLRELAPALKQPLFITYQDACHLAHAQGVRRPPRELLLSIDGLGLLEPDEWELCCGSAGIYNVEKPETASALGSRKAANLSATGARMIATGNIGCMTQLNMHLRRQRSDIPVLHTIQVLDRAYAGTLADIA